MTSPESRHPKKPAEHAARPTHRGVPEGLDTTESGPARLYAPGKPHVVESGPPRLFSPTLGHAPGARQPTGLAAPPGAQAADVTESGPPRLGRRRA